MYPRSWERTGLKSQRSYQLKSSWEGISTKEFIGPANGILDTHHEHSFYLEIKDIILSTGRLSHHPSEAGNWLSSSSPLEPLILPKPQQRKKHTHTQKQPQNTHNSKQHGTNTSLHQHEVTNMIGRRLTNKYILKKEIIQTTWQQTSLCLPGP